jgi:hypothetical protein
LDAQARAFIDVLTGTARSEAFGVDRGVQLSSKGERRLGARSDRDGSEVELVELRRSWMDRESEGLGREERKGCEKEEGEGRGEHVERGRIEGKEREEREW